MSSYTMSSGWLQDRRHIYLQVLRIRCRWCDIVFCVCRRCWRGQAYCGDQCRVAGKRHAHREAQRRYRQTPKGKKAHSRAENRRRIRFATKKRKNMDDATSTPLSGACKLTSVCARSTVGAGLGTIGRCHLCGALGTVVNRFPRRGYGASNHKVYLMHTMRC
jgi:hypothetical protein